jgi:phage-related protein
MMYDLRSPQDAGGIFTSSGSVVEDRVARRFRSLYYGKTQDKPLEFTLVFGANNDLIDSNQFLDRWDMETIASWLTCKDGYRWLDIEQPDMEVVRYRCVITDLRFTTVGWLPWAFECRVVCDSPFAYTFPETFSFRSSGSLQIPFFNRSTYNGYYYPKMHLSTFGTNHVSIVNQSDGGRAFSFTGIPNSSTISIDIDNENGVITNNLGVNLYNNFNFNFFRLVRGDNIISITGNCIVDFICEFPQNIGG